MPHHYYIAGAYRRRDEFRKYAVVLRSKGHAVTSHWLDESYPLDVTVADLTPEENRAAAKADLIDILLADTVVFFAEPPDAQPPRGGRHVEFGYALALRKRIAVIGGEENVFHTLSEVKHYPTFEEFLSHV